MAVFFYFGQGSIYLSLYLSLSPPPPPPSLSPFFSPALSLSFRRKHSITGQKKKTIKASRFGGTFDKLFLQVFFFCHLYQRFLSIFILPWFENVKRGQKVKGPTILPWGYFSQFCRRSFRLRLMRCERSCRIGECLLQSPDRCAHGSDAFHPETNSKPACSQRHGARQ